jgi:hypothetical protein
MLRGLFAGGNGIFEPTLDSRVILVDEVTLDELNSQRRLADTCKEMYERYVRMR